jgi:hypothetical protein
VKSGEVAVNLQVQLQFSDLAKSQMRHGHLAKRQTVPDEILYYEHTRHSCGYYYSLATPQETVYVNSRGFNMRCMG